MMNLSTNDIDTINLYCDVYLHIKERVGDGFRSSDDASIAIRLTELYFDQFIPDALEEE